MACATKWHWSCALKYCKNNWRTPEISYHRMTKVQWASKEATDRYLDVIGCKTKEKVMWTRVVLCSAHWSKQPAMVEVDLPDIKFGSCILWGASTDTSVDTSVDTSIEILVDVSIDTRPILDRYMVGMSTECRSSIDGDSVDNKPLYWPTYRSICLHTHVGRYS